MVLEDGVLHDSSPDGPVLIIACLQRRVLFGSEWPTLLRARSTEQRAPVRVRRTNLGRKVRLCIGIVVLVRVREVRAKSAVKITHASVNVFDTNSDKTTKDTARMRDGEQRGNPYANNAVRES